MVRQLDRLVPWVMPRNRSLSIHRSQCSGYPSVVVPLATTAWLMLQRNLLYAAVTRAKWVVVLVGSWRALWKAVRTVRAGRRNTALVWRLARSTTPGGQHDRTECPTHWSLAGHATLVRQARESAVCAAAPQTWPWALTNTSIPAGKLAVFETS
jgi:hypothetical protein